MISFSRVSKHYPGGHSALLDVSLEIGSGEFVFLTGHSGAGKSTICRLVAGIERASSGTVLVAGQNLASLGRGALAQLRRNIGLVFQDQKLLFDRSTAENVALPLAFAAMPAAEMGPRIRAALDKVGLHGRDRSNPVQLSGGEQQRLAIARAVVNRPALIVADEPTANLDRDTAARILEIFAGFHQVGVTVVVATHDREMARSRDARVLELSGGRLVDRRSGE